MSADFLASQLQRFRALLDTEERLSHRVRDDKYVEFLKSRIADFKDELSVAYRDAVEGGAAEL